MTSSLVLFTYLQLLDLLTTVMHEMGHQIGLDPDGLARAELRRVRDQVLEDLREPQPVPATHDRFVDSQLHR